MRCGGWCARLAFAFASTAPSGRRDGVRADQADREAEHGHHLRDARAPPGPPLDIDSHRSWPLMLALVVVLSLA